MGFPTEFFPVLFAIPRMAGYLAHWRESLDDPDTKIMRPQQVIFLMRYFPLGCSGCLSGLKFLPDQINGKYILSK